MPASPSSAWETTVRLLSRRDRSERDLRRRLSRRGYGEAEVDDAIARAYRCGYLDDARLAHQRAQQLLAAGRAVGPRLRQELRRAGLGEEAVAAAADAAEDAIDSETVLRDLLQRRYPGFDFTTADDRQRRRVIGYFLRRGFPSELVFRVLRTPGDDSF